MLRSVAILCMFLISADIWRDESKPGCVGTDAINILWCVDQDVAVSTSGHCSAA